MPTVGETRTRKDGKAVATFDGQNWIERPIDAAVGGMKPAPAEWGAGAYVLPNGRVVRRGPRGGMDVLGEIQAAAPAGAAPQDRPLDPLTPGSENRTRMALGFGPVIEAQKQMYLSEGWKPGTANPRGQNPYNRDWGARMLEALPFDNGVAARMLGGQDYQDYEGSARTFESAFLPILSGAAVTPSEAQRMIRANLPQMGDTPGRLATKAKNRAMMINATADLLGRPRPFPKVGTWNFGGKSPVEKGSEPKAGTAGANWSDDDLRAEFGD